MDPVKSNPVTVTFHVTQPSHSNTGVSSTVSPTSQTQKVQQSAQEVMEGISKGSSEPAALPLPVTPVVIKDSIYQKAHEHLKGQGDIQKEATRLMEAETFFDKLKIPPEYKCYYKEEAEERINKAPSYSLPKFFVWASKSRSGQYCLWKKEDRSLTFLDSQALTSEWEYQKHNMQNEQEYITARNFFNDSRIQKPAKKIRANELLERAIHTNNEPLLKLCCENQGGINRQDSHGFTPLMLAASIPFNDKKVLGTLVYYGANVHAVDDKGMTALEYLKDNRENLATQIFDDIKVLLLERTRYVKPEEYEIASEELRHWMRGHQNEIEWFQAYKAHNHTLYGLQDICQVVYNHILHQLEIKRSYNKHPQPDKIKLVNHALTFQDILEILAYVQPISSQEPENEIKGKLAQGHDIINSESLSLAALTTNERMVRLLLKAGADTEQYGNYGVSPLMGIIQQNDPEGHRIVQALIEGGANVNYQDSHGVTPLMRTVKKGELNEETLKLLLAHPNIHTELQNESGLTAFMCLLEKYCDNQWEYEIVKLMLDHPVHPVDATAKDKEGNTALMYAINNYCRSTFRRDALLQIVQLLFAHLSEKAPKVIHAQNKQGESAYTLAMKSGSQDIIDLFSN